MSTKTKTTADGFTWLLVTEKASEILSSGLFDIYGLYDDDSEFQILDHAELSKALERGLDIGISVGNVQKPITIEQAKNELYSKGYHTNHLWTNQDVFDKFECSVSAARIVLEKVLNDNELKAYIHKLITQTGNDFNLTKKYNELL